MHTQKCADIADRSSCTSQNCDTSLPTVNLNFASESSDHMALHKLFYLLTYILIRIMIMITLAEQHVVDADVSSAELLYTQILLNLLSDNRILIRLKRTGF